MLENSLQDRINAIEKINRMLPFQYRRDLNKMINHCRSLQTAMSKELVKCRRHITERYLELEKELEVQVETAEQYAVLARLML